MRFVVDGAHPGTAETDWATSRLGRLADLVVPDVDHVLVVAPHPDDEVLGAGGLIQLLAGRGVDVEICAVTDGEGYTGPVTAGVAARLAERRAAEAVSGLRRLGVGPGARTRLGVDDGGVAARETDVVDHLAARLGPRWLCVAPWRHDGHPDHDASGRAAAVAAAATGAHLVEYPVWAWHWADPESDDLPWSRCRRVGLPRAVREAKAAAIAAFVSQTTPTPAGGPPVLPPGVLRRFRRPFEVFVT